MDWTARERRAQKQTTCVTCVDRVPISKSYRTDRMDAPDSELAETKTEIPE